MTDAPMPAEAQTPPPPEIIEVETTEVACDGGPYGHPRVFLNLGRDGEAECPYCDRLFRLKPGVKPAGH